MGWGAWYGYGRGERGSGERERVLEEPACALGAELSVRLGGGEYYDNTSLAEHG